MTTRFGFDFPVFSPLTLLYLESLMWECVDAWMCGDRMAWLPNRLMKSRVITLLLADVLLLRNVGGRMLSQMF